MNPVKLLLLQLIISSYFLLSTRANEVLNNLETTTTYQPPLYAEVSTTDNLDQANATTVPMENKDLGRLHSPPTADKVFEEENRLDANPFVKPIRVDEYNRYKEARYPDRYRYFDKRPYDSAEEDHQALETALEKQAEEKDDRQYDSTTESEEQEDREFEANLTTAAPISSIIRNDTLVELVKKKEAFLSAVLDSYLASMEEELLYTTNDPVSACPAHGWSFYQEACYFYWAGSVTGHEMDDHCRNFDERAVAVSISTAGEQDFVAALFFGSMEYPRLGINQALIKHATAGSDVRFCRPEREVRSNLCFTLNTLIGSNNKKGNHGYMLPSCIHQHRCGAIFPGIACKVDLTKRDSNVTFI